MNTVLKLLIFHLTLTFISMPLLANPLPSRGEWRILLSQDGIFFKVELVNNHLDTPWDVHFTDRNELLFSSRRLGRIQKYHLIKNEVTEVHHFKDVDSYGQGGLLGIAISEDQFVYAYYSYKEKGNRFNKLVRLSLKDKSVHVLIDKIPHSFWHNGGRLAFESPDILLVTTGDGESEDNAQNLNNLGGKILRLSINGKIPKDNPIPGSFVWSFGHRNPQGLVSVQSSKQVWATEHGPETRDEFNLILKGKNYGWPQCLGKELCPKVLNYQPAVQVFYEDDTIAISDLFYYENKTFPDWSGSLFISSLKSGIVSRLTVKEGKVSTQNLIISNEFGRIRDITQNQNGFIYFVTDFGSRSALYKMVPINLLNH